MRSARLKEYDENSHRYPCQDVVQQAPDRIVERRDAGKLHVTSHLQANTPGHNHRLRAAMLTRQTRPLSAKAVAPEPAAMGSFLAFLGDFSAWEQIAKPSSTAK